MVHFSLIGGLIFLLNVTPSPESCLRSFETTSAISAITLDGAGLSVQQDKEDLLHKAVPEGDWKYAAVERLLHHNVIRSYPYGYFSGKPIRTRYEFAVAILRSADMFAEAVKQHETPAKVRPWEVGGDVDGGGGVIPQASSEDLKLLRKLHLEFKAPISQFGEDWAATDSRLQKLQDQVLHRELTVALVAGLPKTDEAAPGLGANVVPRSDWAYNALKQLRHTNDAAITEGRLLTRAEFAGIIEHEVDPFLRTNWTKDAYSGPDPQPPYKLPEVIALHKLVHAFRFEITRSEQVVKLDIKAVEDRLAKAEEKLIAEEEIIDAKPPVPPTNP